jgi:hypothetical protein
MVVEALASDPRIAGGHATAETIKAKVEAFVRGLESDATAKMDFRAEHASAAYKPVPSLAKSNP